MLDSIESFDAILYARVSHDPNGYGRSVREQIGEGSDFAKKNNWPIVKVFKDNDKGASEYSKDKRADWERCIKFLQSPWPRPRILITWENSRAQRDLEVYLQLRKICRANKIRWCYSGRVYDLSRTDDVFTTGLDALLSEREASITRDRIMRAQRANAAEGRPHCGPMYGYVRNYDPKTKAFVSQEIDPVTGPVVMEMYHRIAAGESLNGIVTDFYSRDIPSPRGKRRWVRNVMRQMLLNPQYLGKRVYQGKVVGDAVWPALIDEVTYYNCKRIITDPARRTQRGTSIKHLLSGLVRCGVCHELVYCLSHSRYEVYRCVESPGFHVNMRKHAMEKIVETVLLNRLLQPEFASVFEEDRSEELTTALHEIELKRARLEEFYDEASKGNLSAQALARIEQPLLQEITAAEQRAALASHPMLKGLNNLTNSGDIDTAWEALELTQKREIIRTLMDIELMPPTKRGGSIIDPSRVKIKWKDGHAEDDD